MKPKCCAGFFSVVFFISFIIPCSLFAQSPGNKILDNAKLFSDSDAVNLETYAQALVKQTSVDLIIVTANSTGSKNSMEYADDFFDSNNYGIGPGRDGMLMLINMQAREVWISTHALALDFFRDADIESLLDTIYVPLRQGNYSGAAQAFLKNAAAHIMAKKSAEGPASVTKLDPGTKVWDYAGILQESQEKELSAEAQRIAGAYNVDTVILTITSAGGKSMGRFAEDIFRESGYGIGPDRDGLLLLVKMQKDGNWNLYLFTNGAAHTYISDKEIDALLSSVGADVERKDYGGACRAFIDFAYSKIRINRAKGLDRILARLSPGLIGKSFLFGSGLALIIVLIMYLVQRRRLPRAPAAAAYADANAINFSRREDTFLRTHTSRQAIPKNTSSGSSSTGGGSSGGGSFSSGTSSHRSSGGSSHGGGGRKF